MDIKELRAKSTPELTRLMNELRAQLTQGRFQIATGQFSHLKNQRMARKTLARIETLLCEQPKT